MEEIRIPSASVTAGYQKIDQLELPIKMAALFAQHLMDLLEGVFRIGKSIQNQFQPAEGMGNACTVERVDKTGGMIESDIVLPVDGPDLALKPSRKYEPTGFGSRDRIFKTAVDGGIA